ncbi:c-type cytochrome [Cochlodiniinecator piscidefendens]|uniref:c-type cytochrome n=1 Tax=Cochlodiniinecator piscidefendens TaxID=2715756 RepID=UPI00140C690E|nr:c-type cytochrome [Cochlodiniinecator piscidefendens]
MFDTMTFTKILGGFCGAFLIFLLAKWASDSLYHTAAAGHGAEAHDAYVIEVAEAADAGAEEEGPDFATLLASADIGRGERVFRKCSACHSIAEGENGVGPSLYNIVDRDIASAEGFGFSGTLDGLEGNWTPEQLNAFVESPRNFAPGTAMSFNGLNKIEERANLIGYLQTLSN